MQLNVFDKKDTSLKTREEILSAVRRLRYYHEQGILGGERMPEDSNPSLDKSSKDNFHYFTLPMALNYQRNSYKLWESAVAAYEDPETHFIFIPEKVIDTTEDFLRDALIKHKVALQPNRHCSIWRKICETLTDEYECDVRNLLARNFYDVSMILNDIQINHKKGFPYLSGHKIANYWLYVISQYTDAQLKNKNCLSIAPDTHVIQASVMLGVIESGNDQNIVRTDVAKAWEKILAGTDLSPIDIHTPLWLWSRRHFEPNVWD